MAIDVGPLSTESGSVEVDQQFVVICDELSQEGPEVYGAWDTEHEAAEWVKEHCSIYDDEMGNICELGLTRTQHWVVPVRDAG